MKALLKERCGTVTIHKVLHLTCGSHSYKPNFQRSVHGALKNEVSVNRGLIIARSASHEQENFNVFATISSPVEVTHTSGSYFFKSALPSAFAGFS